LKWWKLIISKTQNGGLSSLVKLQSLDLSSCGSLTDISGLSGLTNLRTLNLSECKSLTDISILSTLVNLNSLNLRYCELLTDISGLSGLVNLQTLDLGGCSSLTDISNIYGLLNLQTLDLGFCGSAINIDGSRDTSWKWWKSIISKTQNGGLSSLINLQSLDLSNCTSLTDLNVLSGLLNLQSLNLSWCPPKTDISGLSGLLNLRTLDLSSCGSLTDISSLSGLVNLRTLDLSSCGSLTDISILSTLVNLNSLNLRYCELLTDISGLAELVNLQNLDLRKCVFLTNLSGLSGLINLQTLFLGDCRRIKSFSPLRKCLALKELDESIIHPVEHTELLCFLAVQRKDASYISENSNKWLKEIELALGHKHSIAMDLACSLARGIVLANLDANSLLFHQILLNYPNVGLTPWKIWFSENLKTFGWDKIQKLAELNKPSEFNFGAIGGISSCLPSLEGDPAQISWARKWISEVHSLHNNNPNFLKPAAAEWCLALKRLGEDELLREWIEEFTDPSDQSALDPINKVFSAYALDLNDSESAWEYALKINDAKLRDESILNLAQKFKKAGDTSKAGAFLFLLNKVESRTQLAYILAEDTTYLKSNENAHRLLAVCGDNLQSFASILDKLRLANPASEILKIMHEKLSDESRSEIPIATVVKECNSLAEFLIHTKDSSQLVRIHQAIDSVVKSS
jgi:Leucine-rich repeat (LRR) protein